MTYTKTKRHTIKAYQYIYKGTFSDGSPRIETQALTIRGCILYPRDQEELTSDRPFFRLCVPEKCELDLDGSMIETHDESLFCIYSLLGGGYDEDISEDYRQYIAEGLRYEGA